jgi:hypothetical protein
MNYANPTFILCVIALVLSVCAFIWPVPWQVPVILISIAAILPH